jgi:hypothetical protein
MSELKILDRGGCADIFIMPEGRILKAFRRRSHTNDLDLVQNWVDHDAVTRAQFRAEALAYERLQSFPALAMYAPRFFGLMDPLQLLGPGKEDSYVHNCGLILEFIPGRAQKLAHLEKSVEEKVALIIEQIRDSLGLDQVWDASCFVPGSRTAFTVIDFAYWNAEYYEMALAAHGALGLEDRAKLERENAN